MPILARRVILPWSKLNFWKPWGPALIQWDSAIRLVKAVARDHLDALDNRANGVAESAAGAVVVVDLWQKVKAP